MKDKKRNCLVFLVLFICLTVCAQSSDKVKAMRNLRDYYTRNINTYDINQDMGKWDLYLKQLSEEGQFADLAAYEKKIHDNNWLSSVSFQDQQEIGFYLADTFRRLWVIANHYRQTNVNDIPERFWKSILRYGDIEVRRQPNDRFHASCFAIPKAACGIYFSLVGQMDLPDDTKPLRKSACRMLKALAMQSWTQPLRNNEMDRDIVRVERFRHHVWWVGGNALAYRPLLETAVLMDSIPMVDVVAEVAKRSLSNVSQTTYNEAFWNEGFTADGAGWGHGMQCLVWGYPIHGASSAQDLLWILRDTPWGQSLTRENVEALLNFYRGSTFYYYRGYIPPCLDRYSMVYYEGKPAHIPYYEMLKASVERWPASFTDSELRELKQLIKEAGQNNIRMEGYPAGRYNGTRWFYNNDDLIKRTPDYYMMVNMASSRCDGLESAGNFADEFNIYTNDGLTLFQRKGDEYRKIIGAMDLTAMPGVTAREGERRLKPITNWRGFCSKYNFAGAATDGGGNAVAGYLFEKMDATSKEKDVKMENPVAFGVRAYKSYFMLGDYLIALGAGVTNLQPEQEGNIRTSIEQTAHQGKVTLYDGKKRWQPSSGIHSLIEKGKPLWVLQEGGFAYAPLPEFSPKAFFLCESRPNEWVKRNLVNKGKKNLPVQADLLRVWVDHGRNVENDVYGYVVYAGEGLPPQENPFDILRNDTLVQAVQSADEKVLEAVFYRAGETVQWSGLPVKTSVPCVLLIERIGEEYSVSVTDPTMNVHLKQVKVEIGDVAIDITLPSGKECGKCVTQRFSPAVEKRRASALNSLIPDKKELDSRMQWFEQARFGMFIHWGVYSSLGCSWNGKKYGGYGEHIQRMARIPVEVYKEKVAGTFNPQEFDAEEWVRIAKETGMGYFIITSKHHDGFAMYDSKVSDYNIVKATPFGRDPMKDLRDACRKAGIKFGFYYSHAFDWGEKEGVGNDWDYDNPGGDKLLGGRDWWETRKDYLPVARKYVDEKAIPQIRELIAMYDPDIMWFDTPHKLPQEECIRIVEATREASPDIIINGRAISGFDRYDYYNTADCPYEFSHYGDSYWEGIPTTNNSYAYNENDQEYKPASFFVRLMAKAAARGGNILMNIGPMGTGKFSAPDLDILKQIAAWWKVNGEASIRGTKATPLAVQSWGESTCKENKLFLHVFDWPRDGKLCVGGLLTEVKGAYLQGNPQRTLKVARMGKDIMIDVPVLCPDTVDAVVVLECEGELKADTRRRISYTQQVDKLRAFDARLEGGARYGGEEVESTCVQNMKRQEDAVVWPVRLDKPMTFEVSITYVAPAPKYEDELVEGDAGKEIRKASSGAAGVYSITLAGKKLVKKVSNGNCITETVGIVTLPAGEFDIRIQGEEIAATELFRPCYITLKPI